MATIQDFVLHPQSGDYYDPTQDRFVCLGIDSRANVVEFGWYAAVLSPEGRRAASQRIWATAIVWD